MESVVLLSGGLDSVVNLKCALDAGGVHLALTFDYGQAAFANERTAALVSADRYGVAHRTVDLGWYRRLLPAAIAGSEDPADVSAGTGMDRKRLVGEAWVPNRNMVLVAIGAAFAEAGGAAQVVVGLNREEAEVFPDNSAAFLDRINRVLEVSALSQIRVTTYTGDMTKQEIVKLGVGIDAPLDVVYSCYRPSDDQRMCGICQSCARLKAALERNGMLAGMAGRFKT